MSTLLLDGRGIGKRSSGLSIGCAVLTSLLAGMFLATLLRQQVGLFTTCGGVITVSALLLHWSLCRRDIATETQPRPFAQGTPSLERTWIAACLWTVSTLVGLLIIENVLG